MNNVKVYLNHFYFSLVVVLLVILVIYALASALGTGAMEPTQPAKVMGISTFGKMLIAAWLLISATLAGVLTAQTIRNRPKDHTVYTSRESY